VKQIKRAMGKPVSGDISREEKPLKKAQDQDKKDLALVS
jgi:hypothetical protein